MAMNTISDDMFAPLPEEERNSEFIAMDSKTYLQDAWGRFKKNKLALISLIFLGIMILLAIFVPIISPYTYDGMSDDVSCHRKFLLLQGLDLSTNLSCHADPGRNTDTNQNGIDIRTKYQHNQDYV